jgi:glycosyltransferase involved in cell wall biosynthesis
VPANEILHAVVHALSLEMGGGRRDYIRPASTSGTIFLPMARVAYLMSHYPAVSHAFVAREVEHLRASGVDVQTVSIRRAQERDLMSEADRRAAASTINVLPAGVGRLISAHLEAFVRSPRRYLATLGLALRTGAPGARERLWHLFYFAEAMILLRDCRRAGVAHIHAQFADSATDVAMLITHYRQGQRVGGQECSWSLAVHGSVEFYDVTRYALASKLAHARFAVAISDFGRSQLMTLSSSERWPHIHVVRCGVDPRVYVPPPQRSSSDRGAEILFVGRLLHGKGLSLLFEAIAELRRQDLEVSASIVGDGPARGEFEAVAQRLGLTRHIRFLGAVGQDDIRETYARADIFCLPSFAEGIPVVAMEAMAMELPVVTTRIMGVPELVTDGTTGLLVAPGRVDALINALEQLVRTPEDRRQIGRAARRKVVQDYDVSRSAQQMRAVLQDELSLHFSG